jgi:hypothetical protein
MCCPMKQLGGAESPLIMQACKALRQITAIKHWPIAENFSDKHGTERSLNLVSMQAIQ